jgi:hypothetical protein
VPDHLIPKPPQLPRSKHTGRQCSAFTCTRNWRCSDQPRSLILLYVGGNDVGPSAGRHLNNRKPVSTSKRPNSRMPAARHAHVASSSRSRQQRIAWGAAVLARRCRR